MSLKFLCPSFRTRYLSIFKHLKKQSNKNKFKKVLNIGCGEGDYDKELRKYSESVCAGDINEHDVNYCKAVNRDKNIIYGIIDAENMSFDDKTFDCVLCIEVLEHVGSIEKSLESIARVLKKNGLLIITVPVENYPFSYDPVNRFLELFNTKVSIGAYAYGHSKLINEKHLTEQLSKLSFRITEKDYMSHHLTGIVEMYWAGIIQKIFKQNSKNIKHREDKRIKLHPNTLNIPKALIKLIDMIISIDKFIFKNSKKSVGLLIVARKL